MQRHPTSNISTALDSPLVVWPYFCCSRFSICWANFSPEEYPTHSLLCLFTCILLSMLSLQRGACMYCMYRQAHSEQDKNARIPIIMHITFGQ
mmetsp:Transcript_10357/g.31855  ORF Transcript_10357/g.31855 Transcript_10357/m.31855 type:complete len:93 (+) Transcript_10357:199-477(+)|eukprot:scaffold164939_cov40-Tisochrysis_lutea.AAC.2